MSALPMMMPKRWLARLPGRPDSAWSLFGLQAGPGAASVSHLALSTSVWDASLLLCCSADSRLALHGAAFSTGIPSCRWILCRVNQPAALVYVTASGRVFECCPSCLMGPDQSFAMPQLLQLMLKASLVQEGGTQERPVSMVMGHLEVRRLPLHPHGLCWVLIMPSLPRGFPAL